MRWSYSEAEASGGVLSLISEGEGVRHRAGLSFAGCSGECTGLQLKDTCRIDQRLCSEPCSCKGRPWGFRDAAAALIMLCLPEVISCELFSVITTETLSVVIKQHNELLMPG